RRTVIDVNGDVTEFGVFNASDDSMRSNTVYTYDEDHRVVREVESLPGQSWDGRDTTWTYYETGEAKTRNYIMPDGRFHNEEFDRKGNQIFMEEGINGTAEVRVETEFNEDGVRVHEVSTGSDYIAERFYDAKGRTERAIRTDLQGNYIQVITYTYHPNGQVATQRTEDYQINHKWYESTYDEAGNEIKTESGSL
ncbi:MAG: hypothetical protein II974_00585, partial [Firmicutes bacterium]|nr:hypothetical protein [Bacillota bacterium]